MSEAIKGIIIGIVAGAPIGVMGLVCVYNILKKGKEHGLRMATGMALANTVLIALYASIATMVAKYVQPYAAYIFILAGVLIVIIGLGVVFRHVYFPRKKPRSIKRFDALQKYPMAIMFVVVMTNPISILATTGFMSLLEVRPVTTVLSIFPIMASVFVGVMVWWIIIYKKDEYIQGKVTNSLIIKINSYIGWLVILFGIVFILKAFLV